jgi:hypothetical protein
MANLDLLRSERIQGSIGAWVTQQARNLGLDFADQGVRFLTPRPKQQVHAKLG